MLYMMCTVLIDEWKSFDQFYVEEFALSQFSHAHNQRITAECNRADVDRQILVFGSSISISHLWLGFKFRFVSLFGQWRVDFG